MPLSVLQSNWYYGERFDKRQPHVRTYLDFDRHGFDQVPTGSNHQLVENFPGTVDYCRARIDPKRLKGFLQTPWRPTIAKFRDHHLAAIAAVRDGIRRCG
jgi:hypothetical protein